MNSDRILYHYTDAAGLLGIVNQRKLWATESNFLNDPAEVTFGAHYLLREIVRRLDESDIEEADRLHDLIVMLEKSYLDPHSPSQYKEDRSFVASFSRQPDVLSLWRTYSGRNGFCIGFSADRLLREFGNGYASEEEHRAASTPEAQRITDARTNFALQARIADILYGEVALGRLLDDLLTANIEKDRLVRDSAARFALRRLAEVKHEGFAEEREVRLIVQETGDFSPGRSVRASPSFGLVSYHPIAFGFESLRSVTIAPGSNFGQIRSALNSLMFMDARGRWGHVEVSDCNIPFAW